MSVTMIDDQLAPYPKRFPHCFPNKQTMLYHTYLTNILNRLQPPIPRPQIGPQRPPKHLQQHLKTDFRHERIIPPLTQLVPYERMLRVRHLVKGKTDSLLMQRLPDQIPAGGRDVVVFLAENLHSHHHHQQQQQRQRPKHSRHGTRNSLVRLTITSSPLISPTLFRLSSPPAPSVFECMSVAK